MIPNDVIEAIREKVNIVEVVGEYMELEETGSNFKAECPFLGHDENTPSFVVSEEKQICKCFGCGRGGNVFSFLMQYHNISFPKAVRMMGDKVGVQVAIYQKYEETESLYDVYEKALQYYRKGTHDYFEERGLTKDTIKKYLLGYCEGTFYQTALETYAESIIKESGLFFKDAVGSSYGDIFSDRYVFPFIDENGLCIGFGGKTLNKEDPSPYRNSRESKMYSKSRFLYGLYQAIDSIRKMGFVIIVEGYFDVLSMSQNGFPNTVGICGTSLTKEHAKLLARYTKNAVLFFDGDKAGEAATDRSVSELYNAGLLVNMLRPPDKVDPDSMCYNDGADAVKFYIKGNTISMATHFKRMCSKKLEDGIDTIREIAQKITDQSRRRRFVMVLSKALDIQPSIIYNEKIMRRQGRKASMDMSKERLLLSALINDRDGFKLPFVENYKFEEEGNDALFNRIKDSDTEASLYDRLDLEETQIMNNLVFVASSKVGVKFAICSLQMDMINDSMKIILKKVKSAERSGDSTKKYTRQIEELLVARERIMT